MSVEYPTLTTSFKTDIGYVTIDLWREGDKADATITVPGPEKATVFQLKNADLRRLLTDLAAVLNPGRYA